MMSRLTASQDAVRKVLIRDLKEVAEDIKNATAEINRLIDDKLDTRVKHYNAIVAEIERLREDVVHTVEMRKRPEDVDFLTQWEDIVFCPIDPIGHIDPPAMTEADDLAGLPDA